LRNQGFFFNRVLYCFMVDKKDNDTIPPGFSAPEILY